LWWNGQRQKKRLFWSTARLYPYNNMEDAKSVGVKYPERVKFTILEAELVPGVEIAMDQDPNGNTVEFVRRDE